MPRSAANTAPTGGRKPARERQGAFGTYAAAVGIFWAYLAGLFLLAKFVIRDTSGLMFVLGTLGVAFLVVTLADWALERRAGTENRQSDNPSGPDITSRE